MKQLVPNHEMKVPKYLFFALEKAFVHAVTFTNKHGKLIQRKAYTDKRIARDIEAKDRLRTPWTKDKTFQDVQAKLYDERDQLKKKLEEVRQHKADLLEAKEKGETHTDKGIAVAHEHHLNTHEKNLHEKLETANHKIMLHDNHHSLLKQKHEEDREKARLKRAEMKKKALEIAEGIKAQDSEEAINSHVDNLPVKHVKILANHHGIKGSTHGDKKAGIKEHYVNEHRVKSVLAKMKEKPAAVPGKTEEEKKRNRSEGMKGNQNAKKDGPVDPSGEERHHLERLGAWGERIISAKKFLFNGLSKDDLDNLELEKRYKKTTRKHLWDAPKGDEAWGRFIEDNGIDPIVGFMIKRVYDRLPNKFNPKNFNDDDERELMSKFYADIAIGFRDVSIQAGREKYDHTRFQKEIFNVVYDAERDFKIAKAEKLFEGDYLADEIAKATARADTMKSKEPNSWNLPSVYDRLFGPGNNWGNVSKAAATKARNSLSNGYDSPFNLRDATDAVTQGFGISNPWAMGTELVEGATGKLKLYFQDTTQKAYHTIPGTLEFNTAEEAEDWLKKRWEALAYYRTDNYRERIYFKTREEVDEFWDKNRGNKAIFWGSGSADVYEDTENGFYLSQNGRKAGYVRYQIENSRAYEVVQKGFKTKLDAEAWLVDNYDERVTELKKYYEVRDDPHKAKPDLDGKDATRKGPEYLEGNPMLGKAEFADVVGKTFKLAGTDSGNWLTIPEQHMHQQKTYLALRDMADMIGLDPEAMGFVDQLKIGWGLAGQGGKNAASAHYQGFESFINLTKNRGAGSLSHEWAHALDDFLGKTYLDTGGYASEHSMMKRTELAKAFQNVMEAINNKKVIDGTAHSQALEELRTKKPALEGRLAGVREAMMTMGNRQMSVSEENKFDTEIFQNIMATARKGSIVNGKSSKTDQEAPEPLIPILNMYKQITGKKMDDEMLKRISWGYEAVAGQYQVLNKKNELYYQTSPTRYRKDAETLGQYWNRDVEKLARAFEAYVEDKLIDSGRKNQYLVHSTTKGDSAKYDFLSHSDGSVSRKPHPHPIDIDRINTNEAFDGLFAAIQKEAGVKLDGKGVKKVDYTAPVEGQVKVIDGKTYIFHNHRWHLQEDVEMAFAEREKRKSGKRGPRGKNKETGEDDPTEDDTTEDDAAIEEREKEKIQMLQKAQDAQEQIKKASFTVDESGLNPDDPFGIKAFAEKHAAIQKKLTEDWYGLKEGVVLPNLTTVKEFKFNEKALYSTAVLEMPNGKTYEMTPHAIALEALMMNDISATINPVDFPGIAADFKKLLNSGKEEREAVSKKSRERYALEKTEREYNNLKKEGATDEELKEFKEKNTVESEAATSGFADGVDDGASSEGLQPYSEHGLKVAREQRSRYPEKAYIPEVLAGTLALRPHQADGVNLILEAYAKGHKGFLLADGTGAGKTTQQLAVAKCQADLGKTVMIVTEKDDIIAGSFTKDAQRMGIEFVHVKEAPEVYEKGKIYITTYNWLHSHNKTGHNFDQIICDESHNLMSYVPQKEKDKYGTEAEEDDKIIGSAQAAHGMGLVMRAGNVLYCSATPLEKAKSVGYITDAFGMDHLSTLQDLGLEGANIRPGLTKSDVFQRMGSFFDQLTEAGMMVKREVSLDNLNINPVDIKLNPEQRAKFESLSFMVNQNYEAAKLAASNGEKSPNGKAIKPGLVAAHGMSQLRLLLEGMKAETMMSEIEKRLQEKGRQIVIFCESVNDSEGEDGNVREGTVRMVERLMKEKGIAYSALHGGVKDSDDEIRKFQSGEKRVIIASMAKGSTGIDLDDQEGDRPRTMLMLSPPFSANKFIQALGRINRMTTKTMSEACLIYSDTDIENWNRGILNDKLKGLGATVEGDYKKMDINSVNADTIQGQEIEEAISEGSLVAVQENHPMPTLDRYLDTLDERKDGVSKYLFRISDFKNFIPRNENGDLDYSVPMKNLIIRVGPHRGKKLSDLTKDEFNAMSRESWGDFSDERLDQINFEGGFKLQENKKASVTDLLKSVTDFRSEILSRFKKTGSFKAPKFLFVGRG